MAKPKTPPLSDELAARIRLVRRDMGNLLFHFTKTPPKDAEISIRTEHSVSTFSNTASGVLRKILYEARLLGTSTWTNGYPAVCFTEAPIHEFNQVFSLVQIAATDAERPRYEPYGIAVPKSWLFAKGGRPVIYDHPETMDDYPNSQKYRFVPYEPGAGIDFTWEREWRIMTEGLELDPKHTLVVVPTADEAFELVYELADIESDEEWDGGGGMPYHLPKWLAVSLDLFGFQAPT